jgi:hypothetical protein
VALYCQMAGAARGKPVALPAVGSAASELDAARLAGLGPESDVEQHPTEPEEPRAIA